MYGKVRKTPMKKPASRGITVSGYVLVTWDIPEHYLTEIGQTFTLKNAIQYAKGMDPTPVEIVYGSLRAEKYEMEK